MQNLKNLTKELVSRDNEYTFFRYLGILPNPDRVLRSTGKTIEAFRALKNDPHVWSCIQSRKSGILSLEWSIHPNGVNAVIHKEISKIFGNLDIYSLIRDILEAPLFGWQPMEIIWEHTSVPYGKIYPKTVIAKPQEWFSFSTDGELKMRVDGINWETVPKMKFLTPVYESGYMNPYGESLLGKCYWPVTFKNGGIRFWVNFMEKFGMPMILGQYTRGTTDDEAQKLAETLAGMTQDSVIVAPADINVDYREAARNSSVDLYKELIKHSNAEISKILLSQTLTTELDMGSYAAAETHFKVRKEVILSDIRIVEETLNKLIGYICELNFKSDGRPLFKIELNDMTWQEKASRDKTLKECGVSFTSEYWRRNYGFSEDELQS